MCGILIIFSKNISVDIEHAKQSLNRLQLRGPDHVFFNVYDNGRVFFGQTVLSITGDPSGKLESFHVSKSGRFDVILNGEIYNYKSLIKELNDRHCVEIISGSDTEVLASLHDYKYPEEVYETLEGMFGYAVYDKDSNKVYIARDSIGEKVLYAYEDNQNFIVSSEVAPILEMVPKIRINRNKLREYFFTRHLLTRFESVFEGIKLIQPGSLSIYDFNKEQLNIVKQYKLSDLIIPEVIKNNSLKPSEQLEEELAFVSAENAKSVIPKDKDYASVFSGGIDSSLSSKFTSEIRKPKMFIALSFPGKDKIAENLTRFQNYLHKEIDVLEVNESVFANAFGKCYQAACAPLATHSFVSQAIMSEYVHKNKIKVLIGGDGADELFGGYEYYKQFADIDRFPEENPSAYSGFVPKDINFNNWDSGELRQKLKKDWNEFADTYSFEKNDFERTLQTVLYSDTVVQLESVGIRASDTMSMLNSVESRGFFITKKMIEFALNLPAKHKIDLNNINPNLMTKTLLKQVFSKKFEQSLIFPKQGFAGYPNEAAKLLLKDSYKITEEFLEIVNLPKVDSAIPREIEWKLMNVELFLSQFKSYI